MPVFDHLVQSLVTFSNLAIGSFKALLDSAGSIHPDNLHGRRHARQEFRVRKNLQEMPSG